MTHDADRIEALGRMAVSHETASRLEIYVDLLLRWQHIKNLVAPSTLDHIWSRHVADSCQLLRVLGTARTIVDFGSGAGFPGLVLAIANSEIQGFCVHLVESNGRKASFLREAARITGAPVLVHAQRIEDFARDWRKQADVVTARALAPLPDLLGYAENFFKSGARALFLKGQGAEAELTEARKYWTIDATLIPSATDSSGQIVSIDRAVRRGISLQNSADGRQQDDKS